MVGLGHKATDCEIQRALGLVLAHGGESQGLEDSGAVARPLVLGLMQAYWQVLESGCRVQGSQSWCQITGGRRPVPDVGCGVQGFLKLVLAC